MTVAAYPKSKAVKRGRHEQATVVVAKTEKKAKKETMATTEKACGLCREIYKSVPEEPGCVGCFENRCDDCVYMCMNDDCKSLICGNCKPKYRCKTCGAPLCSAHTMCSGCERRAVATATATKKTKKASKVEEKKKELRSCTNCSGVATLVQKCATLGCHYYACEDCADWEHNPDWKCPFCYNRSSCHSCGCKITTELQSCNTMIEPGWCPVVTCMECSGGDAIDRKWNCKEHQASEKKKDDPSCPLCMSSINPSKCTNCKRMCCGSCNYVCKEGDCSNMLCGVCYRIHRCIGGGCDNKLCMHHAGGRCYKCRSHSSSSSGVATITHFADGRPKPMAGDIVMAMFKRKEMEEKSAPHQMGRRSAPKKETIPGLMVTLCINCDKRVALDGTTMCELCWRDRQSKMDVASSSSSSPAAAKAFDCEAYGSCREPGVATIARSDGTNVHVCLKHTETEKKKPPPPYRIPSRRDRCIGCDKGRSLCRTLTECPCCEDKFVCDRCAETCQFSGVCAHVRCTECKADGISTCIHCKEKFVCGNHASDPICMTCFETSKKRLIAQTVVRGVLCENVPNEEKLIEEELKRMDKEEEKKKPAPVTIIDAMIARGVSIEGDADKCASMKCTNRTASDTLKCKFCSRGYCFRCMTGCAAAVCDGLICDGCVSKIKGSFDCTRCGATMCSNHMERVCDECDPDGSIMKANPPPKKKQAKRIGASKKKKKLTPTECACCHMEGTGKKHACKTCGHKVCGGCWDRCEAADGCKKSICHDCTHCTDHIGLK